MYWQAAISWLAVFQLVGGSFLLPGDVRPSHYDLRVTYDLDPATNYSYYGVVDILLAANKPTSKIILHAKDFNITSESILISGQQNPPTAKSAIINSTYDFLTITLDRMLDTDVNYTVTIPFYGNLKQGLDGVYISSYVNRLTKVTEYLITTQFEAISARKGFPCFDEPMYKATYRITLGHHKQFTAVSNMPLKSRIEENVLEKYWPWQIVQQKFG
ncbi:unnamed protein product [Diatraea saccharalis]|uniref:Aminopeptidase N-like N-terminal domain-containing protein n=4 Tax=Diatraea saccharalis TaxID=40085 RepID=A0A9N9WKM1_9NEOP|nr:unnamed protein product [Diatraea saccharalis]